MMRRIGNWLKAFGHWIQAALSRIFGAAAGLLGTSSKPSRRQETMSPPQQDTLAERFRLVERGRARGKGNEPAPNEPGLDRVEIEVVEHCNRLMREKKDAYRRTARLTEQRVVPAGAATNADAEVEKACNRMRARVDEERPGLKSLHRSAQKAVDDMRDFQDVHRLTRDAHVPQNLTSSWAILAALLVGETLINGLFFGANLATGLFGGVTYAALISAINVVVFGLLAATAIRQLHHRDQSRNMVGYLLLLIVGTGAVGWNLAVAHYREALPPDYPPAMEAIEEDAADIDLGIAQCWRGPTEADADGEAVCLLVNQWFSLDGFQSYMLMLIGLLMFGVATWKWLRMSDMYPGFGQLERRRQETEKSLLDERQELLERLTDDVEDAEKQQHDIFVDPVGSWKRAMKAHEGLKQAHEDLCDFARELEEECRSAIETYRSANREAPRGAPEPAHWSKPWKASWELPERPARDRDDIGDRRQAEAESRAAQEQRDKRLATLRSCVDECKAQVEQITRISYE